MSMISKGRAVADDYFKRVRAFPLRPIRSESEYEEAGKVLNRPGLVSWYRAEDNPTDAADSNHGTLLNGAGFAAGQVGRAFSFDGVDDQVRAAAAANLDVGTSSG